jgi:hypothetical protein
MRGPRRAIAGLVVLLSGGCQLVAGIEDLHLTGGQGDASSAEASGDGAGTDSSSADSLLPGDVSSETPQGDGAADHFDAQQDSAEEGSADSGVDSTPPSEAGEAGITYAQVVLSDNPLAYWRFDETSGTTAIDSSGNGNTGTYVGGVTLGKPGAIVGDPGTSVGFDGTTAWMNAGDVFAFIGNTPCSFEAWVNPVTDTNYHNVLSRSDGQGGSTTGYLMYIEPASAPALMDFAHYLGGASSIAESNTPIATGTFTHLVGAYDGTSLFIYANGVLLNQNTATIATPTTVNGLVVGAQSGGLTSWFNGEIDEVAVYGTALTLARIQAHYAKGMGM